MSEQLFHIGIKGIIQNDKGEILVLQLNSPSFGSKEIRWDLPGGRMDPGESFESTLAREIKEELSIVYTSKPEFLMATLSNIHIRTESGEVGLVLIVYRLLLPSNFGIVLSGEHISYEWVDIDTAATRFREKYSNDFAAQLKQKLT